MVLAYLYFIGLLLPIGKTHSQSMEFIPNQDSDGSVKLNSFFRFFKFSFRIRTCQKLPNLEDAQVGSISSSGSSNTNSKSMQFSLIQRLRGTRESRVGRSSLTASSSGNSSSHKSSRAREVSRALSFDARPFYVNGNRNL